MNTRNFTVIALFCFATIVASGQEWAPIGAKWHYGVLESAASYVEGHLLYESIGDTIVLGKNCRIIKKTRTYYNKINPYAGKRRVERQLIKNCCRGLFLKFDQCRTNS